MDHAHKRQSIAVTESNADVIDFDKAENTTKKQLQVVSPPALAQVTAVGGKTWANRRVPKSTNLLHALTKKGHIVPNDVGPLRS